MLGISRRAFRFRAGHITAIETTLCVERWMAMGRALQLNRFPRRWSTRGAWLIKRATGYTAGQRCGNSMTGHPCHGLCRDKLQYCLLELVEQLMVDPIS